LEYLDENPDRLTACFQEKLLHMATAFSRHFDLANGTCLHHEIIAGFEVMNDGGFEPNVELGTSQSWSDTNMPNQQFTHKEEWFRQPVCITMHDGSHPFHDMGSPSTTFYHGTTAGVAYLICKSGAFIPGNNGHTKGKTHFKGCFGSTQFQVAMFRGDQTRGLDNSGGVYDFTCCPVVLEFQALCAGIRRYHKYNPAMIVIPGQPGKYLPGLRLMAVHWNVRFVQNYRRLQDSSVRCRIQQLGGVFSACCGGQRQQQDFQGCGAWTDNVYRDFVRLGRHHVCERCHSRWM
jgi:hypothetical protein